MGRDPFMAWPLLAVLAQSRHSPSHLQASEFDLWFILEALEMVQPLVWVTLGGTMKSLKERVRRFLVCEDGPTAVEYAVMLALIVVVCLTAISAVGSKTSSTFDTIANSIAGTTGS
jgi:pilus assembly protein Flp/PilA